MLLATYVATRPGIQGINNKLIRLRLDTDMTHNELVFEPCDGVDLFMPDKTTQVNDKNQLWSASSTIAEKLPEYCPNRPGGFGGVRFKRINVYTDDWITIKLGFPREVRQEAAKWFKENQGAYYDYPLIADYVFWALAKQQVNAYVCSEAIATALKMIEPHRYDPPTLHNTLQYISSI